MTSVEVEVVDAVGRISLNRPDKANAQDFELLDPLDEAWSAMSENPAVSVIVLRANGRHFSAGHDIAAVDGWLRQGTAGGDGPPPFTVEQIWGLEERYYLGLSMKWREIPKPTIAAVQGACVAGGLLLCWPCDLIVAADDAWFSDPVVRMGIGGVEYHAHTWELGARQAKELLFTSGRLPAEAARQLGMVNRVVPADRLDDEVMGLAREIAAQDPFALAQAKRAVNQTLDIMGYTSALRAVFALHQSGHGNALSRTGAPVLAGLQAMARDSAPPGTTS